VLIFVIGAVRTDRT